VVLQEPGRLVLEDAQDPTPGPRDAVIKVHTALTCGTDLKAWRRGHPKMPMPTPFGHEFSGEIVATGADVSGFSVGDALMAANTGPCGDCFFCNADQENFCETLMDEMILGAYAEYLLVPDRVLRRNAFRKPGELSWDEAALLEPLASVCFGLAHVPSRALEAGALVVLIGAGPIAMLWLRALKQRGTAYVIVVGRRRPRLDVALACGADQVVGEGEDVVAAILAASNGRGADLVVECTGQPQVWEQAPGYARKGGAVVLFGGCASGTTANFDTGRLHYDGVRIHSPFHFRPRDVAESFRLLSVPGADWSMLISGTATLAEVPMLFERLGETGGMKFAVRPHDL
ncbi:MAG: L-iditol 2-dehydrogenase, partial [Hyphomicrobiaceae bacterium]